MDIEANARAKLISFLADDFNCIEECQLNLIGFDEGLRADVVAISKTGDDPWVLAFEVKVPNGKWELKHWLNALRQAGNYPNCRVVDDRAGSAFGSLISAAFVYPSPNLLRWSDQDTQNIRFYRDYDIQPLRGAILLAQHFKVGTIQHVSKNSMFKLKLGTDPVWDRVSGFRIKSQSLLGKRKIGSTKRSI